MIRAVTTAAHRVNRAEWVVYPISIGRTTAPDTDAMEALFETQAIITKTRSVRRAEAGEISS